MDFILNILSHIFIDETFSSCSAECPYCCLRRSKKIFCEANLNGIIAQPANTLSNIAYLLVALLIIYKFKSINKNLSLQFSLATVLIGITSIINHATATFLGQVLDLLAIFIMCALIFNLQLDYLNIKNKIYKFLICIVGFIVIPIIFMLLLPQHSVGSVFFFIEALLIIVTELYLVRKNKLKFLEIKDILIGISLIAIAFFVWILDVSKLWCFENNHIFNGHSLWHMLSALALFFTAKYFIRSKI